MSIIIIIIISLLNIVGQRFPSVVRKRFQALAERVYPESQCQCRSPRSTVDMVLSLRQLQEKCREQSNPLCIVCRMEDGRIPKDLLHGELVIGTRPITGRPQLRYKDTCKRDLKALGINTDTWEAAAADRSAWKQEVHKGLSLSLRREPFAECSRGKGHAGRHGPTLTDR